MVAVKQNVGKRKLYAQPIGMNKGIIQSRFLHGKSCFVRGKNYGISSNRYSHLVLLYMQTRGMAYDSSDGA